ncbi:hypothetical protein DL96DRAFT_1622609, partial [Flagelloscypha sp. PMI_526]
MMSQAETLEVFTLRWSTDDGYFPIDLFDNRHFPSLKTLVLGLEWRYRMDQLDLADLALVLSSAPALQVVRLHFKPPHISRAVFIRGWTTLDYVLVEKNVRLKVSAEEADTRSFPASSLELMNPRFFTEDEVFGLLPLTLENGKFEFCTSDGIFDWCTTKIP